MNSKSIVFRICTVVLIAISALTLPWWIPMIGVVLCAFYFRWFMEGIVLGAFIDLLYGSPGATFFGIQHAFLAVSLVVVGISIVLRNVLKFY